MVTVQRGCLAAEVVYRLDPATFAAVVAGRLDVQEAFLNRQIEIEGDLEKGLKLAVLFAQLVRECPYPPVAIREVNHAATVPA
jgi:predicted lipid carrier protein YhbT